MNRDGDNEDGDLAAELRRLRRAAWFFAGCLLLVGVLTAAGLYH